MKNTEILFPPPLEKGDAIALLSPASRVDEKFVKGAMARIVEQGFNPVLMPYAVGRESGSFSSETANRLMDLYDAIKEPAIKAVLCTRGGYGCTHLLHNLSNGIITKNPKWLIGFSDISALHALWHHSGVASIHGPMAKHLATEAFDHPATEAFFEILRNGGHFEYQIPSSPLNVSGKANGTLRGGNFAVINGLANTPYDLFDTNLYKESIFFFEDISEPIYAIERMLYRLFHSGALRKAKALIFGQFTEYRPDKNYQSMEEMIVSFLAHCNITHIPVVFDFPVGHVSMNLPLTIGANVELDVSKEFTRLSF